MDCAFSCGGGHKVVFHFPPEEEVVVNHSSEIEGQFGVVGLTHASATAWPVTLDIDVINSNEADIVVTHGDGGRDVGRSDRSMSVEINGAKTLIEVLLGKVTTRILLLVE